MSLRDVGDPVELAARYEAEGADEIVFLDISATAEERATLLDVARRTAERLFIPLTIGGGMRTADDVARALRAGADKVSINSRGGRAPGAAHRVRGAIRRAVRGREHRREARGRRLAVSTRTAAATRRSSMRWRGRASASRAARARSCSRASIATARAPATISSSRAPSPTRCACPSSRRAARARRAMCARCSRGGRGRRAVAGILHDGSTTVGAIKQLLRRGHSGADGRMT